VKAFAGSYCKADCEDVGYLDHTRVNVSSAAAPLKLIYEPRWPGSST